MKKIVEKMASPIHTIVGVCLITGFPRITLTVLHGRNEKFCENYSRESMQCTMHAILNFKTIGSFQTAAIKRPC